MTLTELRYIVTLAQEQHFGRAAQTCHVSQPTLSIAVKKLEDELGVALFERTRTRVHPTAIGLQVLERARRIIEQAADIRDLANSGVDQLTGALCVGVLPTVAPYLLPQFIPLLQRLAPQMPLYVEEDLASPLAKKLRQGEVDVLIVTAPFSEVDVVTLALFEEPFVLLVPAGHPLAGKTEVGAVDLVGQEVLLPGEGHCFREQILTAFPALRATASRSGVARTGSLETLRHMAASGLGVAILPLGAAQMPLYATNLLTIRPFIEPVPSRQLLLAWRASFPRHKAIDVLRRAVQACSPAYWRYSTGREQDSVGLVVENRDW
jgi:LysR family hydrogen peroxide-inducible transcriptional activator